MFSSKFHSKCRTRDLVRRRRWHRKMVQTDPTAPAVFYISEEVREKVTGNMFVVVVIRLPPFLWWQLKTILLRNLEVISKLA